MSALEKMRGIDAKKEMEESLEDWDGEEKEVWEQVPAGGLGKGYSTLSRSLGQVRTGDWGRRKGSSLKRGEVL